MMQRTKIVAEDSREAMAKVMRECGEDAVILSTRKVPGGVEIIAGHEPKRSPLLDVGLKALKSFSARRDEDHEEHDDHQEDGEIVERSAPAIPSPVAKKSFSDVLKESGRAAELLRPSGFQFRPAPPEVKEEPAKEAAKEGEAAKSVTADPSRLDAIESSIREIRAMLGSELMMGGLKSAGASPALISVFLAQSGALANIEPDRRFAKFLADRMMNKEPPALTGGPRVVLTLGPSGSGKTTLLAQLAAKARMMSPDEKITFVNADANRFGAAEQLRAYGRILDVPVIDIEHPSDLSKLILNSGKRISLFIDMPSQPHENTVLLDVIERHRDELPNILSIGAIASNLSTDAIERILMRYPNLDALALTKLDEAPLSLSTFSLLSLKGPGVAYLASSSHLVKGLVEPDSDMLESVIHASLVGSDAAQLN
jgi:flagellar biosynthesis protein FlhF